MEDFNIILDTKGKLGSKRIDKNVVNKFNDLIKRMDIYNIPSNGF